MREKILLVDDEITNLKLLREILQNQYDLAFAKNGAAALELANQEPDLILLDIMMPEMDGLDVCRQLKADPKTKWIPVVFVTARTTPEDIQEGLAAGAHYYLTKPITPKTLLAVVVSALDGVAALKMIKSEINQTVGALTTLLKGEFQFRNLMQGRSLAVLLANACPDPQKVVVGFTELLVNAVEHGNLSITYDEKSELNDLGVWDMEVERRLRLPENIHKSVEIFLERQDKELRVLIRDQGEGFDWQSYLEFSAERAFDNHGRGIAMANGMCFDRLEYRGKGNEVMVTVFLP
ncbi:MAG: response regulator [Magnetococcus sp. YQC-5]